MTSPLRLLPNFGGEEAGSWRRALRVPRIAAAARAWRFLFPASARIVEGAGSASALDWDAWPAVLENELEHAAFPWLDELSGGVAWLGSEEAHRESNELGISLAGPTGEIVSRVHDKAFGLRAAADAGWVPRVLAGATHVFDPSDLADSSQVLATIAKQVETWPAWARDRPILKPRLGTTGRGRVEARSGEEARKQLVRALPRLAASGGAILEPWLDRCNDLSVQLRIDPSGQVVLLGTLELLVATSGSWQGHRGEVDSRGRVFSGHPVDERLREAGAAVGSSAATAGYRGPAGVDALIFRCPDANGEREVLRPVVELNARFTMGTVAIGLVRRVLSAARAPLALEPGTRRAFLLAADAPPTGWARTTEAASKGRVFVPLWNDGEPVRPAILFARDRADLDAWQRQNE